MLPTDVFFHPSTTIHAGANAIVVGNTTQTLYAGRTSVEGRVGTMRMEYFPPQNH